MIFRFETDKLGVLLPIVERAIQLPTQKSRQAEFRSISRTLKGLKMLSAASEISTISLGFRHDGKRVMLVELFGTNTNLIGSPIPGGENDELGESKR